MTAMALFTSYQPVPTDYPNGLATPLPQLVSRKLRGFCWYW